MSVSAYENTNKKLNGWYAWFVVGVLGLAGIVSYVDRQVINLLVEPIKADLGIIDTQISLLQGFSFVIFYALLSVPLARIADSGNRVQVIIAGIVCWSLATFSCGLAIGFWTLFIARVFVGAGEATLTPSGYSLLGDYFSKEKLPIAISVFNSAGFLGSGVALVIGGFVIDLVSTLDPGNTSLISDLQPWQLVFMLVSLPSILLVLLMFLVREPARKGVTKGSADKIPLNELFRHIKENLAIYIAIFFGFSFMASAQFGIGAWVPSFFIRTYGWEAAEIGTAFGLLATVFSTTGVLTGGWLSSWLMSKGYKTSNFLVPIGAAIMSVPFIISFPLAGDANLSLTLLAPVLFFGAMPFGTGTATLPQIAPNRMRAQIVAIYLVIANLIGFTMGPTLVASFTDWVLGDPKLIRYSISSVVPILVVLGALIVYSGLNSYRKFLSQ